MIIYILFIFSIILNILFFVLDIVPLFDNRRFKYFFNSSISNDEYIKSVIKASFLMMKRKKGYISTSLESSNVILRIRYWLKLNSFSNFAIYNYHRAYLFAGSIEYFKSKGNYDSLNNVITLFDHYVDKDGFPTFKLNKIDQVAWGVSAIELFKYTNNKKYKFFANKLFDFLIKNQNKNGIILYRQGAQQYLNDTLGMICPFLIKYGVAFDNEDALHLAYVNINYFIEYGLDSESRLPFHAFDLESKLKFGPCNWGRGIGWYTIALFYLLKYTNISNNPYYLQHLREYNAVEKVLSKEFTANLWPQFIGQKNIFDSSCSTLFLHSFPKFSESAANKKIIFSCLKEHTTQNGFLFSSSGECMGINRYSLAISFSELSQGMLLYYLAASE